MGVTGTLDSSPLQPGTTVAEVAAEGTGCTLWFEAAVSADTPTQQQATCAPLAQSTSTATRVVQIVPLPHPRDYQKAQEATMAARTTVPLPPYTTQHGDTTYDAAGTATTIPHIHRPPTWAFTPVPPAVDDLGSPNVPHIFAWEEFPFGEVPHGTTKNPSTEAPCPGSLLHDLDARHTNSRGSIQVATLFLIHALGTPLQVAYCMTWMPAKGHILWCLHRPMCRSHIPTGKARTPTPTNTPGLLPCCTTFVHTNQTPGLIRCCTTFLHTNQTPGLIHCCTTFLHTNQTPPRVSPCTTSHSPASHRRGKNLDLVSPIS